MFRQYDSMYPHFFLLEPNTLPIRSGWMDKLLIHSNCGDSFWVKGCFGRSSGGGEREEEEEIDPFTSFDIHSLFHTKDSNFTLLIKSLLQDQEVKRRKRGGGEIQEVEEVRTLSFRLGGRSIGERMEAAKKMAHIQFVKILEEGWFRRNDSNTSSLFTLIITLTITLALTRVHFISSLTSTPYKN
jgi:hypothetical protein